MSTMTQSAPTGGAAPAARTGLAALAEGWYRFWFNPADPTLLGLVRIFAGLVLLYVHVMSGLQLQELYGANAWLNVGTANIIRTEMPWRTPPAHWDARFQVSDKALASLRGNKVPEPLLAKLNALKDKPPEEWEKFQANLSTALNREEMSQFGDLVRICSDLENAPGPPPADMPWDQVPAYRQRWDMDPSLASSRGLPLFSLWFHLTDPTWMTVFHGLMLGVVLLFTLGVGTRVTSVLAWLTALTYIHRIQMAHFGMDTMLAVVLLYLMIAPCGAALSVDRLIARYRVARQYLARRRSVPLLRPAPRVSATFALRLMQVHFCIIYLASGCSKLQGAAWWNGTALWQTAANFEFAGPPSSAVEGLLRGLAENRPLWELVFSAGAAFTLVMEIGLPFLIWFPRCRWLMICGAAALHTGIALMMGGLTTFSLLMLVLLSSFLPPETVRNVLDRLSKGRTRLWLLFNSRATGQARAAGWAIAFDIQDQITGVEVGSAAQRPTEGPAAGVAPAPCLQVVTEDGEARSGYAAVERLTRSLRVLWPVALLTWIPGVGLLGRTLAPGANAGGREKRAGKREAIGAGARR